MYERALSPIRIGAVEVKNRIARTAHATMLARAGRIGEELIAYHLARADGGVGLTILEAAGVHRSSLLSLANLDESIVDGYRALVDRIAPTGMRIFQQRWHGGHIYPQPDGSPPLAPGDLPSHIAGVAPQPMRRDQIDELIAAFAAAAARCERGGLDGVEIHGGHGYLLAQFLSPVHNRRDDEFGGDLDGRSLFLRRVLEAVRASVSPGFAVGVRLSDSADPRILPMSDVSQVAQRLARDGLVDYVNMSYGDYYALHRQVAGMDAPAGFQIPFTAPAVAEVKVPRLLNGRFRTLEEVEQVLRAGEADIISMVRAHIADPDIVAKSAAGHPEQVRPCIACNQGCIGRVVTSGRIGCVVNTAAGDESKLSEKRIVPVDKPLRILVVGGGPAGMEAARIAALAGHRVVLAEAMPSLGGLTTLYRRAPRMGTIPDIVSWLEQEVYRLGVEVRLSTLLEPDEIAREAADHVIVAIGADLEAPLRQVQFPAESLAPEPGARIVSSIELFSDRHADWGSHAVVVDEVGHYEAIACAEYLLNKGIAVTFITRHKLFAPAIDITLRTQAALERLYGLGDFTLRVGSQIAAARAREVDVKPQFGARIEAFPADTIVWVPIRSGQPALAEALRSRGIPVTLVGDAVAARNLQTAIREGHLAARDLSAGLLGADRPMVEALG